MLVIVDRTRPFERSAHARANLRTRLLAASCAHVFGFVATYGRRFFQFRRLDGRDGSFFGFGVLQLRACGEQCKDGDDGDHGGEVTQILHVYTSAETHGNVRTNRGSFDLERHLGLCTVLERRAVGSNEPTLVTLVGSIEPIDAREQHLGAFTTTKPHGMGIALNFAPATTHHRTT
jgi:hypothetical protein